MKKKFFCVLMVVAMLLTMLPATAMAYNVERTYIVAGTGNGGFLNGVYWDPTDESNAMYKVSNLEYEIIFDDVPAGTYEFKIAANGSWEDNWGWDETGVVKDYMGYSAVYGGDNIVLNVPKDGSRVSIYLNLRGSDADRKNGGYFRVEIWTPYTLTWVVDGVRYEQSVLNGDEIIAPEDPVKEGYAFWGWSSDAVDHVLPYMPKSDLTYTAEFVEGGKVSYIGWLDYYEHQIELLEDGYFTMPDPLTSFDEPVMLKGYEILGYSTTEDSETVEFEIGERVPVSAGRSFYAVLADCEHSTRRVEVTPPTCDQYGYTANICTICGDVDYTDHVYSDYHDYDYEAAIIVPPTCTEQGYKIYDCSNCGQFVPPYEDDKTPALGHDFGNGDTCRVCGSTDKTIVVNLYDRDGDGWDGNYLEVYQGDTLLATLTVPVGYGDTWSVPYDNMKAYTFKWNYGGDDAQDASFEILVNGKQIADAQNNPSIADGASFTLEKDCRHNFNRNCVCLICGDSMPLYINVGSTHSYGAGSIIGDSWYGSGVEVYADGVLVGTASKYEEGVPVEVWKCPYDPTKEYTFRWIDGKYSDEEAYFDIVLDGETLYSVEAGGCTDFANGQHLLTLPKQEIRPATADMKFQTKTDGNSADLRLVTWVDTLDYEQVYFNVTIGGQTAAIPCTTVYSSINADGTALGDAAAVFGGEASYFVTYTIKNIPAAAYNEAIQVSVTWTDLDGYSVTSEIRTIVLADAL